MAFALHIITSSTDHYTFAFDGEPTVDEIIQEVKDTLFDEFDYIDSYYHNSTYKIDFKM